MALVDLAENGFGGEQLAEMQKIIDAEKSDLFDVLAHVAYALAPMTREARATRARVYISTSFSNKQQGFLDFVLSHYVRVGVEELDLDKLTPLLKLKYHDSIPDFLGGGGQTALGSDDPIIKGLILSMFAVAGFPVSAARARCRSSLRNWR